MKITGKIVDITDEGKAVVKNDGKVIFTDEGLIDDIVELEIKKEKKSYLIGETISILQKSKDRIEPLCPYYKECSGCRYQELSYEKELEIKKRSVEEKIKRLAEIDLDIEINGGKEEGYRNKISLKSDNNYNLGYYKRKTNDLVKIESCKIANELINKTLKHILENKNSIEKDALLKELVIRKGLDDEIMIIIETNYAGRNSFYKLSEKLQKYNYIKSIYIKYKNKKTMPRDYTFKKIFGEDKIKYKYGEYEFYFSPDSFLQVNDLVAPSLYKKAKELIDGKKPKVLIDLFSGIGTTTINFSKGLVKAVGIEINEYAVEDAIKNSKINNLDNVFFYKLDANKEFDQIKRLKPDLITVDPPRFGLSKDLIEQIVVSKIPSILYISCNPSSLARDLKIFKDSGYKIENIELYDMFQGQCTWRR